MKNYQKPIMTESSISLESVYAGSGEEEPISRCSNGRRKFNPHADSCQRCLGLNYYQPGMVCPQGMPQK